LVGNKTRFEPLLESMMRLAGDLSDPYSQKAAFLFLTRSVGTWGQPVPGSSANGDGQLESEGLPGFDRFIYENVVPLAFRVLSTPEFNIKDGQVIVVIFHCSVLDFKKCPLILHLLRRFSTRLQT